jgi:putative transport protein
MNPSIFLIKLFGNQIFLLSIAVASGVLLGRIKIKGVGLGSSGALFTGLVVGWLGGRVSEDFFIWNLIFFVAAVGLLSSKDIVGVVRRYGYRFILLAVAVTGAGALATYVSALLLSGSVEPLLVGGTYTGALTSSPGLGAALEAAGGNILVTIGYTIAYPFGVVSVVLFVQFIPVLMKVDISKERLELREIIRGGILQEDPSEPSAPFTLISFVICMIGGIFVGSISVPIPRVGDFSLGSTGGTLLFSLFIGARGHLGPFSMRLDIRVLSAIRSISLAYFLAVMGILAGPDIPRILAEYGVSLLGIGMVSAVVSLMTGLIVGRGVFRLNWVLLLGAIPGAMTSTPGLGAAIESTECDECSAGYGATYPAAIFCMVLFTKLIIHALV